MFLGPTLMFQSLKNEDHPWFTIVFIISIIVCVIAVVQGVRGLKNIVDSIDEGVLGNLRVEDNMNSHSQDINFNQMNGLLEEVLFFNNHSISFENIAEEDYKKISLKIINLINGHFKKYNLNDLNNIFSDTKEAFSLKTDFELKRAYVLFKIIGNSTFVKLTTSLTKFALKFHFPVTPIIKLSVFDHFCGGVSEEDCVPVINKMFNKNVHSVLDFSTEGFDSEKEFLVI